MRLQTTATPSNTPTNTPTQTPSGSNCVNPTPTSSSTPTPTITPTITASRDVPTIYVHLCIPDVVPANGIVNVCSYATTENTCTGSTTQVPSFVEPISDIGIFLDGEFTPFYSTGFCAPLYSGDSCRCSDCAFDFGAELSGYTLSAITYGVFTTGTTLANYIHTLDCFTPECVQCFVTPTPTITPTLTPTPTITTTLTPTPSITPTITPTITQTPTPSETPPVPCDCYRFQNETGTADTVDYVICGGSATSESIPAGQIRYRCVEGGTTPTSASITITQCGSNCTIDDNCTNCS